jgi:dTDP-4-amino-4,6-dideoxygalactose transaminase
MKKIPLSQCFLDDELKQAALRALESGWYILAKECEAFEAELARHTGTKHAVLCSSWTAGVMMLHQAMGLKPGDEVLVPSHTAFPSIEPMIHWGAKPAFIDIDDTYTLDVEQLEAAITPRTVGILPVHLYGHPANLDRVFEIARKRGLWVIEDCAQAQGAKFNGKTVGSMGIAGAFSFFPSKNLTVLGDGGCICTNDDAIAERVRKLRNHGRKDKYTHEEVGYNLRFNEIQAAVGRVGLKNLDRLNGGRRRVAARYNERLKGIVQTPPERPWATAVYHMYVIRAERRDELARHLQQSGIGTGIHYPVANHQQPAITKLYKDIPRLPRTEQAVKEILSLPIYGELPLEDVDTVCDCIAEFYKK